jgi:hypothetical protein
MWECHQSKKQFLCKALSRRWLNPHPWVSRRLSLCLEAWFLALCPSLWKLFVELYCCSLQTPSRSLGLCKRWHFRSSLLRLIPFETCLLSLTQASSLIRWCPASTFWCLLSQPSYHKCSEVPMRGRKIPTKFWNLHFSKLSNHSYLSIDRASFMIQVLPYW